MNSRYQLFTLPVLFTLFFGLVCCNSALAARPSLSGLQAQIDALETENAAQQVQIDDLLGIVADLQDQIDNLSGGGSGVPPDIAALNNYLDVDVTNDKIIIEGANLIIYPKRHGRFHHR